MQSNNAALIDIITMFHAFAALANQSLDLAAPLTAQANPPSSFPAFISIDQSPISKSLLMLFFFIKTSILLDIA